MPSIARRGRQESSSEHERDQADRHVDEEDPTPRSVGNDDATDHGSEDRAEQLGDTDDPHHLTHSLGPRGACHDRLADGQDHPATEPL